MPCWFYEKKDLRNTASYQDGISPEVEARYRREGARFILDAGTKMGLRFDTCGTGVVYFHRFYMFHSFREFHRYVTGACCLFLAGKVEETPKKCKDIIKICQSLLTPQQFAVFGDDPKEEVMTLERILLQTIKFDLRLEHPYTFLLKFAKILKGDKHKIQKMVQMAWTFINDHLCTTLCLQWEAEIIAVSLMYLASRLSKFDIQDWDGKPPGSRMKWWEWFVEGITMDLMEDICHQVLDLYSTSPQKREESPPMITQRQSGSNSSNSAASSKSPQMSATKRNRTTPSSPGDPPMKQNRSSSRNDAASSSSSSSSEIAPSDCASNNKRNQQPLAPVNTSKTPPPSSTASSAYSNPSGPITSHPPPQQPPPQQQPPPTQQQSQQPPPPPQISAPKIGQPIGPITGQGIVNQSSNNDSQSLDYSTNNDNFSQYNPYMPSQMYSSSFMSHEGTQNIQSLISQSRPSQVTDLHTTAPPPQTGHVNPPTPQYLPPPGASYQPPPPFPPQPTAPGYPPTSRPYPPPPSSLPPQDTNLYQYPPPGTYPPQPATSSAPPPTTGPPPPPPTLPGSYQAPNYPPPLQTGYQPNYPPPPPAPTQTYTDSQGTYKVVNTGTTTPSLYQQPPPHYPPPTGYSAPPPPGTTSPNRPPPTRNTLTPQQTKVNPNPNPGLPTVRITGRQNRR